ncbi:MAG: hypothetical protein KAX16_03315, partial [Actinomycetia bacterium]|nr:hypothetical protein [Actinomycetes bacterium]
MLKKYSSILIVCFLCLPYVCVADIGWITTGSVGNIEVEELKSISGDDFQVRNIVGDQKIDVGVFSLNGKENSIGFNVKMIKAKVNLDDASGELGVDFQVVKLGIAKQGDRHFQYLAGNAGAFEVRLELDYEPGFGVITGGTTLDLDHPENWPQPKPYTLILKNKYSGKVYKLTGVPGDGRLTMAIQNWASRVLTFDWGEWASKWFGWLRRGEDSTLTGSSTYEGEFYRTDTTHLDDAREEHVKPTRTEALDLSRRLAMNKVDVFFLADNTGSMSAEIDEVKARAQAILDALAGNDPRFQNVNGQWGVGRFSDDQIANPGSPGYELLQQITDDKTLVENG